MSTTSLTHTIDVYLSCLTYYSLDQLRIQPSTESWSMGQLYEHLIWDSQFYIEQIQFCMNNNDHADEPMSASALTLFQNNALPDIRIKGNAKHATLPQPESKEFLIQALTDVRDQFQMQHSLLIQSKNNGKSRHSGLGYFNASEWYQFADMHFRHHLKQKQRIEDFWLANR